jgi:hypothetical protein
MPDGASHRGIRVCRNPNDPDSLSYGRDYVRADHRILKVISAVPDSMCTGGRRAILDDARHKSPDRPPTHLESIFCVVTTACLRPNIGHSFICIHRGEFN